MEKAQRKYVIEQYECRYQRYNEKFENVVSWGMGKSGVHYKTFFTI